MVKKNDCGSTRIMLNFLKNLFKPKHRHKWHGYLFHNREHAMIWRIRKCSCGAQEMLHAGGTGDGKWHSFDFNEGPNFRFDWEEAWFNDAKSVTEY